MSDDHFEEAMRDVWAWKRQAEEATRGMGTEELIEFYRRQAEDAERRLGVHLKTHTSARLTQKRSD
jgi:hypothetical protein